MVQQAVGSTILAPRAQPPHGPTARGGPAAPAAPALRLTPREPAGGAAVDADARGGWQQRGRGFACPRAPSRGTHEEAQAPQAPVQAQQPGPWRAESGAHPSQFFLFRGRMRLLRFCYAGDAYTVM